MYPNIAVSIGIKKEDFNNLDKIMKEFSFLKFICIDVANGYSFKGPGFDINGYDFMFEKKKNQNLKFKTKYFTPSIKIYIKTS